LFKEFAIILVLVSFGSFANAQPIPKATPVPLPTTEKEALPPDPTRQMTDEEMEQTCGEKASEEEVLRTRSLLNNKEGYDPNWKARYREAAGNNNWWRLIPPPYPYQKAPIPIPVIYRPF
jgi:hypothetical protein